MRETAKKDHYERLLSRTAKSGGQESWLREIAGRNN